MDDQTTVEPAGPVEPNQLVEATSEIFVGEWNRLVSTTNWEKGRIIFEWRQALVESSAPVQAYSDETWARRVGGVSSQHVGRLRRVHERFAATRTTYPTLYWSHFQAALDWNDAELWLEGARLEGWSVAEMRARRWEAHGAPAELKPREEEIVAAELDEDFLAEANAAAALGADPSDLPAIDRAAEDAGADDDSVGEQEPSADDSPAYDDERVPAATASLAGFSNLPDDLLESFEACKLAIVRHRLAGWADVTPATVISALEALIDLTQAPLES